MTEVLEMMKKAITMPKNGNEYRKLNRELKTKCRQAKEKWPSGKCAEIERMSDTNAAKVGTTE